MKEIQQNVKRAEETLAIIPKRENNNTLHSSSLVLPQKGSPELDRQSKNKIEFDPVPS